MGTNYSKICRIKGRSGLFDIVSQKGSNLLLSKIGSQMVTTVEDYRCMKLSDLVFYTELGKKDLKIDEVFKNMDSIPCLDQPIKNIMSLMVPFYDDVEFKYYHAKRVLEWYKIIRKNEGKI